MKQSHPLDILETISKALVVIVVFCAVLMAAAIIFPEFRYYMNTLYF